MDPWGAVEPEDTWGSGPGATAPSSKANEEWDSKPRTVDSGADDFKDQQQWDNGTGNTAQENSGADDQKCYGCGQVGHRAAECPNPREMTCRYCKAPGHMVKDCPDKPPMSCENCGQEGHMRKDCVNARKINRDHIADLTPEDAWSKLGRAVAERDVDDVKEAINEYVKAVNAKITFRELQEALFNNGIKLFLIGIEKPLMKVLTNIDFQGNMGKKYSVSYRFSEFPDRPREVDSFPKSREELLARLDDAGDVVNKGVPLCRNCDELGHIAKYCPQEKVIFERPKIICSNCNIEGHRLRDCKEPRKDRFACRNCGKSGHKAADCDEPPNLDNVQCRKCDEYGHFAKDCPKASVMVCRNCDQEGHMSRECPEPRDWSRVQCSNCQQFGHTKVKCKAPVAAPSDDFVSEYHGGKADNGDTGKGLSAAPEVAPEVAPGAETHPERAWGPETGGGWEGDIWQLESPGS
ncbi:hypothetical protein CDD82_3601 [Ophiocordyceps australis]|uniref:Uncharacterized protein n=1 Tax=Ophiocordyceps australis TaxID=1399860 RepID=A0A2C5ZDH3_9HYPO|nr:hypothetical protein CDD82_3601 [Ophiocordyceps australis]